MKAYPVLKEVTPLDDYRLLLTFDRDEKRMYDFKPNLSHKYYSSLTDIRLFKGL